MSSTSVKDLNSCRDFCARAMLHDLSSPFMFVRLDMLHVSMMVELSYDFMRLEDYQGVCHLVMT